MADECECEQCDECNGSGIVWFDIGGKYTRRRTDDLSNSEPCHECHGRGITFMCFNCADQMDEMMQEQES